MVGRFNQFLRDVRAEMEQVSWPTRQELIDSTRVILVVTALLAVFIGVCDWGLSQAMVWLWRVAG
ncbi:MAG: preprotein translocase subunit SecE [Candidatus Omnitrophica bacterium]|nr:preprotein translocase subunit SecE [Candidatus Omnitrophota bacterium]